MNDAPEYAFITCAPLLRSGDAVFSPSAVARARSLAPAFALSALGYEASVYSLAGGAAAPQAALGHSKAVVFGEGPLERYRPLLAAVTNRAVLDLAAVPDELRGWPSARHIPDACDGPVFAPLAARAPRHSRLLSWLGERVGLASEALRIHLLWSGEAQEIAALVDAYPALEALGRRTPLLLRCLCPQGPALEALADRLVERDPEAIRIAVEAWTPQAMVRALASCDIVLLPAASSLPGAIRAGRYAVGLASAHYGPLADFAWVGDDVAAGIAWTLSHPREVLQRLAHGQEYVNRVHAPEPVARAWLKLFREVKK